MNVNYSAKYNSPKVAGGRWREWKILSILHKLTPQNMALFSTMGDRVQCGILLITRNLLGLLLFRKQVALSVLSVTGWRR